MVDHNVSKLNIHVYQIYICLCAVYILVHNDCQLSHPIDHTLLSKCMEEKVRLQLTLVAVCSWALASLGLASVPHYSFSSLLAWPLSLSSLPAPAQLSDPRPGRTLIKSGCCCWQSKRKNFRTNSLALFLSWLMMMLARSQHSRWPVAAAAKAALHHFSWQSGAKSRRATLRIASHRTKPFSSQWAAALSRTIYQQRFSCRGFSLSLSLSRLKLETRTVEGNNKQKKKMKLRP